jgi:uncharacterized protein YjiS (DUF1127 family)
MSTFICHAVVAKTYLTTATAENQTEQDLFEARDAELSQQLRRQKIAGHAAAVASVWAKLVDRMTRRSREAQARRDLREKLENMPAYMLNDIGVNRDQMGRICFRNEFGMLVELTSAKVEKPAVQARSTGKLAYAAA